jgi:hypothetical protein
MLALTKHHVNVMCCLGKKSIISTASFLALYCKVYITCLQQEYYLTVTALSPFLPLQRIPFWFLKVECGGVMNHPEQKRTVIHVKDLFAIKGRIKSHIAQTM